MQLTAEDKIEIQQLSSKYAIAMDNRDLETWMSTWAENGTWNGGIGKFEGHENLKRVLELLAERLTGKRHIMANFVIEGNGQQASQICYLLIVDSTRQAPPGVAVYTDRLEKSNSGEWRFVSRSVKID